MSEPEYGIHTRIESESKARRNPISLSEPGQISNPYAASAPEKPGNPS